MASASLAQRQILRAQSEARASLAGVRSLRDQWVASGGGGQNPAGLSQKELDHLSKAFKNRLLTLKWDCEDLEELASGENNDKNASSTCNRDSLAETRALIRECRDELTRCMAHIEDCESARRTLSKHGITTKTASTPVPATPVTAIVQNPLHAGNYERLSNGHLDGEALIANGFGAELAHFDKSQMETSTTIFSNALHEHYEQEEALNKSAHATKVFNNLTRPSADDICVGTNENEMILEMLETEYYDPPPGLLAKTKYGGALRNFFDADRNKFLGTFAFLVSFPILFILFLVI